MRQLALLLVPAALWGGPARFARLGEFDGTVEVQLRPSDAWAPAERNLPLVEGAWVRTAAAARVEMEFDDGCVLRLGPESLAEISDYTRLSTGQRVTLVSLDRGVAYFTGMPEGRDSLTLAVPGAQLTLTRGARLRLEAADPWSQAAVFEGAARFSSPAAEFDLTEGQTARVEPAHTSRFFLYREVAPMELDRWSERRDKFLSTSAAAAHVPVGYGLADLDAAGEWIQTDDLGSVWKPKLPEGWAPYRAGRWRWYDTLGYTWVGDEAWGWLPYHYGRWTLREQVGWVWAPSKAAVFKPGEVYWLRGARMAGWGPLAPGEDWTPAAAPRQFLNANTTWAWFQADARTIDPAGFDARPKEPLGAAAFTAALPSPAFPASRLDAIRPPLRVSATRVVPVISGVTYGSAGESSRVTASTEPAPVTVVTNPASAQPPVVVVQTPPPPPQEVIYPVPVYTGIVVVNPPEDEGRRRGWGGSGTQPAQPKPAATPPAATQQPARSVVSHTDPGRGETQGRRITTPPPPSQPPAQPPAQQQQPARSVVPHTDPGRGETQGRRVTTPPPSPPPPAQPPSQPPASAVSRPDTGRGTVQDRRVERKAEEKKPEQ